MLALPLRVVHCLVGTQKVGAGHVRSGYGRPALMRFSVRRAAAPCVWSDPGLRKTWTWSIRRVDTEFYSRLIKINIAKCDFPLKSVAVWNISRFFSWIRLYSYHIGSGSEDLEERIRGSGGTDPQLWFPGPSHGGGNPGPQQKLVTKTFYLAPHNFPILLFLSVIPYSFIHSMFENGFLLLL